MTRTELQRQLRQLYVAHQEQGQCTTCDTQITKVFDVIDAYVKTANEPKILWTAAHIAERYGWASPDVARARLSKRRVKRWGTRDSLESGRPQSVFDPAEVIAVFGRDGCRTHMEKN